MTEGFVAYIFAQRLTQLREEYNLKRRDIAKILNKTRSLVSYYETAERQPSFDALLILADYFNVSIDWLIGRTDYREVGYSTEEMPLGRTTPVPAIGPSIAPHSRIDSPENVLEYVDVPVKKLKDGEYFYLIQENGKREYALIEQQNDISNRDLHAIQIGNRVELLRATKKEGIVILYRGNDSEEEEPKLYKRGDIKVLGRAIEITADLLSSSEPTGHEQDIPV